MDQFEFSGSGGYPPNPPNGGVGHNPQGLEANPNAPPAKWHSYKMLVDPSIHRGAPKMMRYDGCIVPGNPHHVAPTLTDPRNRLPNSLWRRMEAMDIPVPRFKIDEYYVGEPPKVEVTLENMNDNIDKHFLNNMVSKFGVIEDMIIYFHPVTGKHLGLAHLFFEEVKSAKECVKQLHGKSVMGQQINCYIDPLAKSCTKMFVELTEEKKPEPLPPPPPLPPAALVVPSQITDSVVDDVPMQDDNYGGVDEDPVSSPTEPRGSWGHRRDFNRRDSHDGGRRSESSRGLDRRHSREYSRDPRQQQHVQQVPTEAVDHHQEQPPILDRQFSSVPDLSSQHILNDDQHYQQTHYDPNYWQQQAQQYAAATLQQQHQVVTNAVGEQQPEHEQQIVEEEVVKDGNDEDDSDHQVDLDTRLKLLMKGKAGAAMPSFLLNELNGSEEDEEESEGEIKDTKPKIEDDFSKLPQVFQQKQPPAPPVFVEELPLSRAPSPFLSNEQYQSCHHDWQSERKAKFIQANKPMKGSPKSDDCMSLSSLSSGENHILEQGTMELPHYYGYYPPPPGFDPNQQQWYAQHQMQPPPEGYQPHVWPSGYNMPHQQQQQPFLFDQQGHWNDPYSAIQDSLKSGKSDRNTFRPIIQKAVQVVVKDLTRTLTKDIKKRMCETLAFYLMEKWWTDQETKYKQKHSNVPFSKSSSAKSSAPIIAKAEILPLLSTPTSSKNDSGVAKLPRIPRAEDISTLFDKQRENMETSGGKAAFGFGFRGTIPKLPAFKNKAPGQSSSNITSKVSSKKHKKDRRHRGEYSSDEEADETSKTSKKNSDRRRDQEKRREERRKEKEVEKQTTIKSPTPSTSTASNKKNTLSSIYSTLYTDTDESKDTDLSDFGKPTSSKKDIQKKKKSSSSSPPPPPPPPAKTSSSARKKTTSVTSTAGSSSNEEEDDESSSKKSESSDEIIPAAKSKKTKKLDKPMKKTTDKIKDIDESSQSSVKKSPSGTSSGSSNSSSSESSESSESSAESSSSEKEDSKSEKVTKPVPMRRASETLKTDSSNKKAVPEVEEATNAEEEPPSHITDHCYARPVVQDKQADAFESQFANDHGYTRPRTPPGKSLVKKVAKPILAPPPLKKAKIIQTPAVQPVVQPPPRPRRTFKERSVREEFDIVYKFLTKGLDLEDIKYLKISYEMMLVERQELSKLLNYTHWVDHTVTEILDPPSKNRRKSEGDFSKPHLTGACRTEGYYKMDSREKARTKYHLQRNDAMEANGLVNTEGSVTKPKIHTALSMSREARSNQRRQLAVLGDEASSSDLLKFNQLKFRRKNMTFGKSAIHDWGLFARESIGADEMVIEYVGNVVRPVISDVREKRYEKQGIGSSYLFRIDQDYVVDATKCGNLARFINHSCDPNCYAKVITVDAEKKIVIYSKQPIAFGEEITYDYKFPIEDEKIVCLCATKNCRKYLN